MGLSVLVSVLALVVLLHYRPRFAMPLATVSPICVLCSSPAPGRRERSDNQSYLRENLNAMASKLGEMQAQLVRLDALGERLTKVRGLQAAGLHVRASCPGAAVRSPRCRARDLSLGELGAQLDRLTRELDDRSDKLGVLESSITLRPRASRSSSPRCCRSRPATTRRTSAGASTRSTGSSAFHEGIDFIAEQGTPVLRRRGRRGGVCRLPSTVW